MAAGTLLGAIAGYSGLCAVSSTEPAALRAVPSIA